MTTHYFTKEIADVVGVQAAVIFENLKDWVAKNEANDTNFHDGRYWTYNSVNAFSKLFSYMTAKQIRLAIEKLKEAGLIITANYNASAYDRTLWYALTDEAILMFLKSKVDLPFRENENALNGEPIPNSKPNINNKEKDISTLHSDISSEKKISKRFQKPTIEEIREYIKEQGYSVVPEAFFDYYESNGWHVGKNPMKDWKACVRTFQRNSEKYNYSNNKKNSNELALDREFIIG